MDITILKKIGLSDKEVGIYLALLENGASSVRGLVDFTGLNRGTVYDILKSLQEKGLASFYHQETKQKFVAEDADKLIKLVNNEEEKIKKVKEKLHDLIPELESLQAKGGSRPATKFYEGKKGIRFILEDVLNSVREEKEKQYFIYSATKASEDINNAYPDFTRDRIKRGIKVKAISLASGGKIYGLDERRWLGTNDESATFVLIYAGKCAFISRDVRDLPVGVIIENKMIYETQKIIFLRLWDLIK
ncbi:MAG: helix-turn-helix domain-containing protein [Patescibacteria group bacterium]|nr:helix-turn-helix domain-containing protein [Patescibacteria group bacterium]